MLKRYLVNGKEFQYEEGEQPSGAVELKPEKKAVKAQSNKSRQTKNK